MSSSFHNSSRHLGVKSRNLPTTMVTSDALALGESADIWDLPLNSEVVGVNPPLFGNSWAGRVVPGSHGGNLSWTKLVTFGCRSKSHGLTWPFQTYTKHSTPIVTCGNRSSQRSYGNCNDATWSKKNTRAMPSVSKGISSPPNWDVQRPVWYCIMHKSQKVCNVFWDNILQIYTVISILYTSQYPYCVGSPIHFLNLFWPESHSRSTK